MTELEIAERQRLTAKIEALVAALSVARDTFEGIRYDAQYQASNETMSACRDAVDRIDAVIATVVDP